MSTGMILGIGLVSHPRTDGIGWAKSKVGFRPFGKPLRSYHTYEFIYLFYYLLAYYLFIELSMFYVCFF